MLNLMPILSKVLILTLLLPALAFAQEATQLNSESANHFNCGMASPTESDIRFTKEVVAKALILRNSGTTCLPLKAYIVRKSDGTGGTTTADLNKALTGLNKSFLNAGIEFYWAAMPQYADNDDFYSFGSQSPDSDTEAGLRALFKPANDAINIYYINTINGSTSAYSYFPLNNAAGNMTVISHKYASSHKLLSHELGHYFSLYHTHQGTELGNTHPNAENVARVGERANCSTTGDLLCDTPADPKAVWNYGGQGVNVSNNCTYIGIAEDIYGERYKPSSENIMSYFPLICKGHYFTNEQSKRIAQALVVRKTFTAYTMTAPPMNVKNPSHLIVKKGLDGVALLNWRDNADNEMGYLIERSTTSDKSGFEAIADGAVDANLNTFTDNDVVEGVTYFYRVKATNDDCNHYSNTVAYTMNSKSPTFFKARLTVHPNPTQGSFVLTYYTFTENTKLIDLKIYDSLGRVVLTPQYKPVLGFNQLVINLPNDLPNGIYSIIFVNDNDVLNVAKVLKAN
jgi:hypothetical protein